MQTNEFSYHLPDDLIAHHPAPRRGQSRLLCLNRASGEIQHRRFPDLLEYLDPRDLLVFNNTRVIPARLHGEKETGGRVEVLLERILQDGAALAQVRASKTPRQGSRLLFPSPGDGDAESGTRGVVVTVTGRQGEFFLLQFDLQCPLLEYLEQVGHVPLPPYIRRADGARDRERYQTVYGVVPGAVAAPTAGLHFGTDFLAQLEARGILSAQVTLHVGAGTFQPVRVASIAEHRMHSEWLEVSPQTVAAVAACRQRGGRVVAVGTTTVRSLETAARGGALAPFRGETDIFIYPGFRFRVVDAMLTNFHLPESTLLMLVSAFAGKEKILGAYESAVGERYRFFSYGDAMFIF